jgi:hypothetical protein
MNASSQSFKLTEIDTVNYFDFWEGDWEGKWPEGDKMGKATNELTWITGGKVLQENFQVIEGQSKGFIGTSISVYRPQQDQWKQAWADNQGGYFDFEGSFDGDNRIFQTQIVEQNGNAVVSRMVFKDITKNSFTWDWEGSQDGGKTWTLNWQIKYVRVE